MAAGKAFSLQVKLVVLVVLGVLIPTFAANFLLRKVGDPLKHKGAALGIRQLSSQENTRLDVFEYLEGQKPGLQRLEEGLDLLESASRIFLIGSVVFVPLVGLLFWGFLTSSVSPLAEFFEKIRRFEKEDAKNSDLDLGTIHTSLEKFLQTTRNILGETYSLTQEMRGKIEPLTTSVVFSDENVRHFFTDVQEISRSSNYIANTLESTTASIEEVSTSAQTIADRSQKAAQDSADAATIATEGGKAVSETISTMESIKDEVIALEDVIENLNSASKQIGEIVNTITAIAHQTNLLALNAAIEAARAGEHGQGFTVVADEVRKLAEESGEAAEDIGKKVKGMLEKTGKAVQTINKGAARVMEGVNVANIAGKNLTLIVASVTNVNKMIQDISNASREQSANIDSLRQNIESIFGATRITSEGTKRVANGVNEQLTYIRQYVGTNKEILTLAQLMSDMLEKFNFR